MTDKRDVGVLSKKLRIKYNYPKELASHFVNNIMVQHQSDFFVLQFFELWPPAIIGETEKEKEEKLEEMTEVEATCVSRIVLTPSKMREFMKLMTENLQNYETMMGLRPPASKTK
ncbi:MAG: DUF3467 domain-containing protein [Candidatus Krumholzibacteria bacterium]|nr:DUF3467 domain-containing protein [Candidatus Krumholzibacteria bacterium]